MPVAFRYGGFPTLRLPSPLAGEGDREAVG